MTSKQVNAIKLLLIGIVGLILTVLHWITDEGIYGVFGFFTLGYALGFLYKWRPKHYLIHYLAKGSEGTVVVSTTFCEELSIRDVRLRIGKVLKAESLVLSFQQMSSRQAKEINKTDWEAEWTKISLKE